MSEVRWTLKDIMRKLVFLILSLLLLFSILIYHYLFVAGGSI